MRPRNDVQLFSVNYKHQSCHIGFGKGIEVCGVVWYHKKVIVFAKCIEMYQIQTGNRTNYTLDVFFIVAMRFRFDQ